jgi:hypothetical protein
MRIAPVVFVVIAGCKSKAAEPVAAVKQPFVLSIAGKPVVVKEAYVKALPVDGAYSVYLTDGTSSCQELMDSVYMRRDEDQTVLFSIGKRLGSDGTLTSGVTDVLRMGRDVTIAPGSKAALDGDVLSVDADVEVAGEGTIAMHGKLTPKLCGTQAFAASDLPKAVHPSTATITVAGKQVSIVGARRKVRSDELELSTAPLACTDSTPIGAIMVDYTRGFWHLRGAWLGTATLQNNSMRDKDGQPETKGLVIEPGAAGAGEDGATIQLAVRGSGTIAGYSIALAGTVEAVDCP